MKSKASFWQRVGLHDAGVALERAIGDFPLDGQVEQPSGSGGSHAYPRFGTLGENRVDNLDGT